MEIVLSAEQIAKSYFPADPIALQKAILRLVISEQKKSEADEREACAKVAEDDTSFMMLQDFGMQQTCTQVRTNIAAAIRARGQREG